MFVKEKCPTFTLPPFLTFRLQKKDLLFSDILYNTNKCDTPRFSVIPPFQLLRGFQ